MEKQTIPDMFPAYFERTLENEHLQMVEEWKNASDENLQIFNDSKNVWEKMELLQRMQKYNAQKALENVDRKINRNRSSKFFQLFQRVAAILILPLIIAFLYFSTRNLNTEKIDTNWYTLKTGAGMRSEFVLPDGTKVFLNSNTTLRYPIAFSGPTRDVELEGEAYFDVEENKAIPFIVNTGKIQIEVTGTEFKASNYSTENLTEVVLVEGSVNLCQCNSTGEKRIIQAMKPGDRAILEADNKLYLEDVIVDKYIAWKSGVLMFRDDSMAEVVRRLNRWYNVDIQLAGTDFGDYMYTATFMDESLIQVLDLLKLSAPIDYKIKKRKRKNDNTFNKMEIEITQK